MTDSEKFPFVLVEKQWLDGVRYEVWHNTMTKRVVELRPGELTHQFYNYSGWVSGSVHKGRIVGRYARGSEAGQVKHQLIVAWKVMGT